MDPLSALSIATGIITFVDFGGKLISLYSEIQRTGRPSALSDLEDHLRDLSANATHAKETIAKLQEHYPHQVESLDRLGTECLLAQRELQDLTPMRGGRGAKALGAVRSLFKQGDFKRLEDRLRSIRERTMMAVIMCIAQVTGDTQDTVLRMKRADTTHTLLKRQNTFNKKQTIAQPNPNEGPSNAAERDPVAEALWESIVAAERAGPHASSAPSVDRVEEPPAPPAHGDAIRTRILDGLKFNDMMAREDRIQSPFPETFQWLLGDGSRRSGSEDGDDSDDNDDGDGGDDSDGRPSAYPQTGFKEWLESAINDTPYWITGKPASGKSTLMKFICTNPELPGHLRLWAGEELELLVCSVYIWNPGSSQQKNQVGLLRTMLYQLLSQLSHKRPDLCSLVAGSRCMYFQLAGAGAPNPPDWTVDQLRDAVARLLDTIRNTNRVAAFIDGLDEYEGNQFELVSFFQQLHQEHELKLCFSSRPLNVFRDQFRTYPSLKMEELTRPDIEHYVHTRLKGSHAFEELRAMEAEEIERLETQIVDKAQGVFLWVILVVERLVTTAQDLNDMGAIWKVFEALPEGLIDLYKTMRERLSPPFARQASMMYQLLLRWKEVVTDRPFDSWIFWTAISHEDPEQLRQPPTAQQQIDETVTLLGRRLAGCTGGMLQVADGAVDFLHKTAFDWSKQIQADITQDGPPGYEPSLVIASVLVSLFGQADHPILKGHQRWRLFVHIFNFGMDCDDLEEVRAKLLRIFDRLEWETLIYFLAENEAKMGISQSTYARQSASALRWFLAAELVCPQYLRARLESGSHPESLASHWRPSWLWRKHEREWIYRLIIGALGTSMGHQPTRLLNGKLKCFEVLLEAEFATRREAISTIRSGIKNGVWWGRYGEALLTMAQGRGRIELVSEHDEDDS